MYYQTEPAPDFDEIQALIAEHGPELAERILRGAVRHTVCPPRPARGACTLNRYTAQPRDGGLSTATGGTRARRTTTEGWIR